MNHGLPTFWSIPSVELLQQLQTSLQGLTSEEAQQRLFRYGANLLKPKRKLDALTLLLAQFNLFLHDFMSHMLNRTRGGVPWS